MQLLFAGFKSYEPYEYTDCGAVCGNQGDLQPCLSADGKRMQKELKGSLEWH